MLVIFTVILLGLLVLGLPVAFSLGTAGPLGMFAFMGGGSSFGQRYRFWLTNLWMILG